MSGSINVDKAIVCRHVDRQSTTDYRESTFGQRAVESFRFITFVYYAHDCDFLPFKVFVRDIHFVSLHVSVALRANI